MPTFRFASLISFLFAAFALPAQAVGKDISSNFDASLQLAVDPLLSEIGYRLPLEEPAALWTPQSVVVEGPIDISAQPTASIPVAGGQKLPPAGNRAVEEDYDPLLVRGPQTPSWDEIRNYEIAYQALNLVDAVQTAVALRSGRVREANPLMGENPSTITVVGFKAAVGGAHYALTRWIMREHPRFARLFQYASIAYQGSAVTWNLTQIF